MLFEAHWSAPTPEWSDQFTSMYLLWERLGQPILAERGAAILFAINRDADVLELCCGDGFYTRFFYSGRAAAITAVDFDTDAIAYARRYNSAPNISYALADIRVALPDGPFDVAIWNGAIEHFTEQEIATLVGKIQQRLRPDGVVCGYTIASVGDSFSLEHHEYEFRSKEDLLDRFTSFFRNVRVFEMIWPERLGLPEGVKRHNLYFYASNGPVPFDDEWPAGAVSRRSANLIDSGVTG